MLGKSVIASVWSVELLKEFFFSSYNMFIIIVVACEKKSLLLLLGAHLGQLKDEYYFIVIYLNDYWFYWQTYIMSTLRLLLSYIIYNILIMLWMKSLVISGGWVPAQLRG